MSEHILQRLDYTNRSLKRAQYEAFEFSLTDRGVLVRNESYADPENHEYLVTVRNGVPTTCECPADAHFEGACKHRLAVAIRAPILQAAQKVERVVTDGGVAPATAPEVDEPSCEECFPGFTCWECYLSEKMGSVE
ncbi:SWIM zinc finger family protein [Haladaptatus sp. GCM10025707]|uniref:SWIM zinc finger family protein n=1 Tax=unclassified Haladaptatus TaxID=2622732 RepID=UPI0023E887F8|nr:SWIM zinc finger family protein [Haladaptatus sp. QDMS2]